MTHSNEIDELAIREDLKFGKLRKHSDNSNTFFLDRFCDSAPSHKLGHLVHN